MSDSKVSLASLPDDLLRYVTRFVSELETILALTVTCKSLWKALHPSKCPRFWPFLLKLHSSDGRVVYELPTQVAADACSRFPDSIPEAMRADFLAKAAVVNIAICQKQTRLFEDICKAMGKKADELGRVPLTYFTSASPNVAAKLLIAAQRRAAKCEDDIIVKSTMAAMSFFGGVEECDDEHWHTGQFSDEKMSPPMPVFREEVFDFKVAQALQTQVAEPSGSGMHPTTATVSMAIGSPKFATTEPMPLSTDSSSAIDAVDDSGFADGFEKVALDDEEFYSTYAAESRCRSKTFGLDPSKCVSPLFRTAAAVRYESSPEIAATGDVYLSDSSSDFDIGALTYGPTAVEPPIAITTADGLRSRKPTVIVSTFSGDDYDDHKDKEYYGARDSSSSSEEPAAAVGLDVEVVADGELVEIPSLTYELKLMRGTALHRAVLKLDCELVTNLIDSMRDKKAFKCECTSLFDFVGSDENGDGENAAVTAAVTEVGDDASVSEVQNARVLNVNMAAFESELQKRGEWRYSLSDANSQVVDVGSEKGTAFELLNAILTTVRNKSLGFAAEVSEEMEAKYSAIRQLFCDPLRMALPFLTAHHLHRWLLHSPNAMYHCAFCHERVCMFHPVAGGKDKDTLPVRVCVMCCTPLCGCALSKDQCTVCNSWFTVSVSRSRR